MQWPLAMPTSERLPKRMDGRPYSADVLVFLAKAQLWLVGSYMFDSETGTDGSWGINGEVVDAGDVTHWMPLPPAP